MGLFGPRTTIYVSSTIYNMAGEYDERTNYLKFLVLNGVLSKSDRSVADVVNSGTLNGPRMNYQAFFRWAKLHYPEGMPEGGIFGSTDVPLDLVNAVIPTDPGIGADTNLAVLGFSDFEQWAEKYVIENHPDLINTDWLSEIDDTTNEITITYEDTSTESFMPTDFDPEAKYIYARYNEVVLPADPTPQLVSTGSETGPFDLEADLPNVGNHYLIDETDEFGVTLNLYNVKTTTKTYSDGRPTVVDVVTTLADTTTYDRLLQSFEKYMGIRADLINPDRSWFDINRTVIWEEPAYDNVHVGTTVNVTEIEPGVFETATEEEYEDQFRVSGSQWWYRSDAYEKDLGIKSVAKMFIYKMGSGETTLDELDEGATTLDGYFPMIPIRTNNKMINEEPHLSAIYPQAKLAWKRASGNKKIDKLIDQVGDNDDLADIDYAFVIWGVALNNLTREGKRYIYEFFRSMMDQQLAGTVEFSEYLAQEAAYKAYLDQLQAYQDTGSTDPQTEAPVAPEAPVLGVDKTTTVRLHGMVPETAHYDFRLSWNAIEETIHAGQWKPGAKLNEIKIQKAAPITVQTGYGNQLSGPVRYFTKKYQVFEIYFQDELNQYRILKVTGAQHNNVVYKNKSVTINSDDALDDGDDSGFIIPLHYSTLKKMPIVWANQLATEGQLLVFNCYKVFKKKWYQTFLGAVLIGLLTMGAGAIFSGGASVLGGAGILGSNVAVGAMFGMTGVAGALVGAAVNSVIMTTIMAVIQEVAEKLGPLGAIFSAIAGIIIGGMTASAMSGGGMHIDFSIFMRADNLLKLTNATVTAYSMVVAQKTGDVYAQMNSLDEQYKKQKREIDALMYELTGFSSGFDPMALTDIKESSYESQDTFITRTLMSGSDIAAMTQTLISEFANISTDLDALKG